MLSQVNSKNKENIAFTGITKDELVLLNITENKFLNIFTNNTTQLITYKCIFTKKYIQALKIKLPIISIDFFHINSLSNTCGIMQIKKLRPFEGAVFSTSNITNPLYGNYFVLNGAFFEPNCSIVIDFLICDEQNSSKYLFCKEHNIPIIHTSDVFTNKYDLYLKPNKVYAYEINKIGIFSNRIFYIDERLPKLLYNKLKRFIIENDGIRFPSITDNVQYILTNRSNSHLFTNENIYYYQFVFDCIENNALLYEEPYKIKIPKYSSILANCLISIDHNTYKKEFDKQYKENDDSYINNLLKNKIDEIENKIRSLGGLIQENIDMRTTHVITNNSKLESIQYKIITEEWLNECIVHMKKIDESKFKPLANMFKKSINTTKIILQITGIEKEYEKKIIQYCTKHDITLIKSKTYNNKCTHLIMGTLVTTEKFFCALVNGCWILRPEIFDELENNLTIDIQNESICEKYEWNTENCLLTKKKDLKIINSIKIWRIKIHNNKIKPFQAWKVKLCINKRDLPLYTTIIVNGGGTVVTTDYTHMFVDTNVNKNNSTDPTKVYPINYIFNYLIKK
ncbi:Dolichyl-phosphate-mannose--protein O-mannosyl transferase [Enterocytozoon bieneusi H348]|nr:Dolichyl-phosphate-mannose--protein O-mannosyl transferase [Enterocytozoon bieneusi H348]|eukprot:XP_001828123.1 Dolichyl-phosphate-mannose--protein O-mannosyl transferase [Enterocytozoon bieneusi H348]